MNLFAKMDADLDSNPKIMRAGPMGTYVFLFVLRRNAKLGATGTIPAVNVEPWYVARQTGLDPEEAERAIAACVRHRLLAIEGDQAVIVGWDDDYGRRPMTEAERKAQQRARKKPPTPAPQLMLAAPTIADTSPDADVTCPDSHGSDQIRSEKEEEERERETALARAIPHTQMPDGWGPEPSIENTHASLEAERRGVVVPFALQKFRERMKASAVTASDWDAKWRECLLTEHPTPSQIRDAFLRIDREKKARDERERERDIARTPREPASDDVIRMAATWRPPPVIDVPAVTKPPMNPLADELANMARSAIATDFQEPPDGEP
jgi:hypothetical protein